MKIRLFAAALAMSAASINIVAPASDAAGPSESQISKTTKITRGPFVATNGNVSVVTWVESVGEDASRVMASTKVGSAAWSKGSEIAGVEWSRWTNPMPAVTASGRIFVAWTDDEDIRFRERTVAGAWTSEAALPGSTFDGQWQDDLDVVANGEVITVVAAHSMSTTLSVISWTRQSVADSFVSQPVADVPSGSELGTCNLTTIEACRYGIFDLRLAKNSAGVQAVVFLTHRDSANWDLPGSRFAITSVVRSSTSTDWQSPKLLDSMVPTSKDTMGYAYFLDGIVITPNGKVAVAWSRGLESTGYEARVAVKSSGSETFVLQDTSVFRSGYATSNAQLGVVGNSLFVAYKAIAKPSSDPIQKFGSVGNLTKTGKTLSLDANWDVQSVFSKDGDLTVLLAPDRDTKNTGAWTSSRKTDGTWTSPTKRSLTTPAFFYGLSDAFDLAITGTEQFMVFSKQSGTCPNCTKVGIFATNFK